MADEETQREITPAERKRQQEERGDQVIAWINRVSPAGITCPVCHHNSWSVGTEIFELRQFNEGDVVLGEGVPILPVVPVTCTTCANTLFFNAIQMGLLEPDNRSDKS